MYDQDIIEKNGMRFRIHIEDDGDHGAPWEDYDGHGVISDWTQGDKKPGERVLCTDRSSKRFYDVQATMKVAKRDGWGLGPEAKQKLADKLGRVPTAGEITAQAVENDFEHLRRWCTDQWRYVGVCVEQIDEDDQPLTDKYEYACWGMESDDAAGLEEAAEDYADQIIRANVAAEAAAIAEEMEVEYWNSRGVVTV